MNSKKRVITTLKNKIPDQVPVFATLTPQVAEKLSDDMDIPTKVEDSFLSTRISHTEILLELGNDAIGIGAGRSFDSPTEKLEDGRLKDEWGIIYKKVGLYSEAVERPLSYVEKTSDLYDYEFPKAEAEGRFDLAKIQTEKYGDQYAVIASVEAFMFELAWNLVGLEKFLLDLAQKKPYIIDLLDKLQEYNLNCAKKLINIGADVIWTGDDFGTQIGMLISPDLWREVFKPRYKKVYYELKKEKSDIIIAHHSCGSIFPIIEDMIEIGLDVLNPIQPKAKDMDLKKLKQKYGKEIAFFGGIDIQEILPYGTTKEVEKEVKNKIAIAGKNGGYLLAPAHNIQPDTSLENIYKLFESVKKYGKYPLKI